MKECTSCKVNLSLDNYYKKGKGFHNYCKPCLTKQVVERQRKIKLDALKYKGNKCEHCGYNKYPGALQFHHLDSSIKDPQWKNFKLRKFNDAFKAELDKCIILCANCHAEEHNM